jgi:hypothetical protein
MMTLPIGGIIQIERYRRRENSVEEALMEMYLAGVSVRRVEDITEALWSSKVSPSTISELNKKAYVHIEDWRNRPLQGGRQFSGRQLCPHAGLCPTAPCSWFSVDGKKHMNMKHLETAIEDVFIAG